MSVTRTAGGGYSGQDIYLVDPTTLDLASGLTQALTDGTNTYLYGNMRLAQQTSTSTEYFLTDALGSVRQLVDENGDLTRTQAYQPYGESLSGEGSGTSSYGFTGEWTALACNTCEHGITRRNKVGFCLKTHPGWSKIYIFMPRPILSIAETH